MVCSFAEPDKIKEWIEICKLMKSMNPIVCFHFQPTQLTIQMKHSSNRCILDMNFPCSWFSFYDWKDSEICVSTETLFTIFSQYSGEKIISMESEKKSFIIKCFHDHQNKNFSIPIIFDQKNIVHVKYDPGIEFNVNPSFFHPICSELFKFDDIVNFNIKKEFFHMTSYGREKMMIEIQPMIIEMTQEGNYDNSFQLFYLLLFLKFSVSYPKLVVGLSNLLLFSIDKDYRLHYYVCSVKS
jgi:hypothetical protein